jgi:acetyl esterase
MPELDPAMAAILAEAARQDLPPYETLPAAEARAVSEERNRVWNDPIVPVARVEDRTIQGPRGPLRLRIYDPRASAEGAAPCLLYIHGGGWVICSLDTHDGVCRRLANAGGFVVVGLDYALAPELPYPHGLEDCAAALRWLRREGATIGIDPGRIAVAGDSAGANLALALCLTLREAGEEQPRAAGLVYGVYSDDHESPSHAAFGGGEYLLSTPTMRWFWDHYVPDPARRRDPLVSPLYADLRGLPPLYVSAAEFDPLCDDSERLARRLIEVGVDLDWRLWRGVTHACFMMSPALPAADRQIADAAGFLARRLAP